MGDLKQCPFCASANVELQHWTVRDNGGRYHWEYAIVCGNCGAFGPSDLGESGAIEMWNMRREKFPDGGMEPGPTTRIEEWPEVEWPE